MSIRKKTILIFGISFAILVGAVLYTSNFFVQSSSLALETSTVNHRLALLKQELEYRLEVMSLINKDWGIWSATYQFAKGENSDYTATDVTPTFMDYSQLNFFFVVDASGKLISAIYRQLPPNWDQDFELLLQQKITSLFTNLIGSSSVKEQSGFLELGGFTLLVSGHQILKSDFSGPSQGILLMGRFIDQRFLVSLAGAETQKVEIISADKLAPTTGQATISATKHTPAISTTRTESKITSQTILPSLDGQNLLLAVSIDRNQFNVIEKASYYYNIGLGFLGLLFGLISLLFMEKVVLAPLTRFTRAVSKIDKGEDSPKHLPVQTKDELGQLAESINKMLQTIDNYQKEKNARQFQDLVERSLVATLVIAQDHVVYQSQVQKDICGELPLNFNIYNFVSLNLNPKDRHEFLQCYNKVKEEPASQVDLEGRVFKFDQGYREEPEEKCLLMRIKGTTYQGEDAVIINALDITTFKKMEEALRLREKMASLGNVATGIAHEIRNPLSSISIIIDTLLANIDASSDFQSEEVELLRRARQSTGHISAVIRRVLDFARPSQPCLAPFSLGHAILNAVELSRVELRKQNVELELNLNDNIPEILLNRQLIEELFLNLIANAVQAMEGQSGRKKIYISTRQKNGDLIANVADSGPGLTKSDEENIFQPFYTTKKDGSGIGLNICQRIVLDHNGSIELVHSRLGGAEFQITFPILPLVTSETD